MVVEQQRGTTPPEVDPDDRRPAVLVVHTRAGRMHTGSIGPYGSAVAGLMQAVSHRPHGAVAIQVAGASTAIIPLENIDSMVVQVVEEMC